MPDGGIWYDRAAFRWMRGGVPLGREPTPEERFDADLRAEQAALLERDRLTALGQADMFAIEGEIVPDRPELAEESGRIP